MLYEFRKNTTVAVKNIQNVYQNYALAIVEKWCAKFRCGNFQLDDYVLTKKKTVKGLE